MTVSYGYPKMPNLKYSLVEHIMRSKGRTVGGRGYIDIAFEASLDG